jgi:tetratricopeptide (TPR) repeat protein
MTQHKRTPRFSAASATAQSADNRRQQASLPISLLASLFLGVIGSTACNPSVKQASQLDGPSDPCSIALLTSEGGRAVDGPVQRLQKEIREANNPAAKLERLGWLYVSRARTGHDPGFYKLAGQAAACIEKSDRDSVAALLLRGHVQQNLHRFHESEQAARRLVARRESPLDYGLLGDALMEQGRLDEAATAYQKMVDLRPGLESYSRAAHLRWLHGDVEGATALMRLAARAGGSRNAEPTAWAYSRLALYELQSAEFERALQAARDALKLQPQYAPALLATGRVLLAKGEPAQAIEPLSEAARLNPLPEYQWLFAEALRAAGRVDESVRIETEIERQGAIDDPRTFSLFLATRERSVTTAVQLAERELAVRSDVFTHDALAWSLYAAGETQRASAAMKNALSAGTQDARLFLHAALIAAATGESGEAARFRQKADSLGHLLLPSERERLKAAHIAATTAAAPKPSSS